jgi:hypothetical protein
MFLFSTNSIRAESRFIFGYIPQTNKVRISPFGLVILLIVLIVIWNKISLFISRNSFIKIS